MTGKRFQELMSAGKPIFIENEIAEMAYDFTDYPRLRVKSMSGPVVSRMYDKTYDQDVDTLLYGTEISEERFNSFGKH